MATVDELINDAQTRMGKSVEHARESFNTVRTGRASASLLDRLPERARPGPVAGRDREPAPARPAAAAVHDDRDRAGEAGQLRLGRGPGAGESADLREQVHAAPPGRLRLP